MSPALWPMRLAGTPHHGLSARFRRWAYQASVMKTLEHTSSRIVSAVTFIA